MQLTAPGSLSYAAFVDVRQGDAFLAYAYELDALT